MCSWNCFGHKPWTFSLYRQENHCDSNPGQFFKQSLHWAYRLLPHRTVIKQGCPFVSLQGDQCRLVPASFL